MSNGNYHLPTERLTDSGAERRVGVEIELSGIDLPTMIGALQLHFSGNIRRVSSYEMRLDDTEFGSFGVEIDSQMIKWMGREIVKRDHPLVGLQYRATDAMGLLMMNVVPGEVVTPPIPLSKLPDLDPAIESLREAGAKGTHASPWYAFGVHFNVELPHVDAATITAYMKAFVILSDWLIGHEAVDITRRIPPYINPYPPGYAQKLSNPDYWPDTSGLIDDYLKDNPTRNRVLDMLPFFHFLDAQRVVSKVDDPLVSGRPTLHYRLPNSEIDDPDWGLHQAWNDWMQVEALANDVERLERWSYRYWLYLQQPMKWPFIDPWLKQVQACLVDL
jgi:hypothetical protein